MLRCLLCSYFCNWSYEAILLQFYICKLSAALEQNQIQFELKQQDHHLILSLCNINFRFKHKKSDKRACKSGQFLQLSATLRFQQIHVVSFNTKLKPKATNSLTQIPYKLSTHFDEYHGHWQTKRMKAWGKHRRKENAVGFWFINFQQDVLTQLGY